ncbi:transketolase family protein [Metabacillus rhizolycopersici]|uniref:Transketolase family protein n=1 Tax=Metabacillus rhizolycopersici TaxID=2875709 RepID=A0ABS7UL30_9BACI|nr:transketolase C-terminal domain-containing protein [Metabacillus rhizolycopersici]MBZ5749033.1 transketolase family protein [Metabacillus rhizolycopersici]
MTFILEKAEKEMRQAYAETIYHLAKQDPDVIVMEADLSSAMSTGSLKDKLPNQYVNIGIMEANMMSLAAGLNVTGRKPFIHSFGQFLTRRAFDQLFVSLAYAQLSAVLVGSDAGVTAEHNGGTHMTFEDMGLMRLVPKAHVYEASDPTQLAYLLEKGYKEGGVHYIRTIRKSPVKLYDEQTNFEKAQVLREGTDVTLVASGMMVAEALKAADLLAKEGIEAEVIDMFYIKPLDSETLLRSVRKTGKVVTAENHNVISGLGSAVSECLAENYPAPVRRVGVREQFGQVGVTPYLQEFYGLTAENIAKEAGNLVNK